MRKTISGILAILLLLTCLCIGVLPAYAATKAQTTRAIAIVFDNSGSMYVGGQKAWCRATYAMEVFASMLNDGDTLLIYPMNPISVNGNEYTMDNPLIIDDPSKASQIRSIYTEDAADTPIESIDAAAAGLRATTADKKYMIVLTDGSTFFKEGQQLSESQTQQELTAYFDRYAGASMDVLYLGIGSIVAMPAKAESDCFLKSQAADSKDVLSKLTVMCNRIFGRDSLPKSHINGNTLDIDISTSKLIVFVQGENVSGVSAACNSGTAGTQTSSSEAQYATNGCGNYTAVEDTSLQGMLVTYTDCPAGKYTINYTGTASSIEVYYEPDADLDFVFTDMNGNAVDPNALYEGDYKVSFGMKDAKTGELIKSDLLGKPEYTGSYHTTANGEEHPLSCNGMNGEELISLGVGDVFGAELTVTYLGGYTITKSSKDFGWPEGGINVSPRPAGDLRLDISGTGETYKLATLQDGSPYTATVYYKGEQLTGDALQSVELKWNSEISNADIQKEFLNDHYDLTLHYKDASDPTSTACGECTLTVYAYYTEPGSTQAEAQTALSYTIEDSSSSLSLTLSAPQDYYVISELAEGESITASVLNNGQKLSAEELSALELTVDCGGINHTVTPLPEQSAFEIKLQPTDGIQDGKYKIKASATIADEIGRTASDGDEQEIELSGMPLWLRWLILALALLILALIIIAILHIRVMPIGLTVSKNNGTKITYDDEDETVNSGIHAALEKSVFGVTSTLPGNQKVGLRMDVRPGKDSYLKTARKSRSADVKSGSIRATGSATVREATINRIKYILNEDTGKLERVPKSDAPIKIKAGTPITYGGILQSRGETKSFFVSTKLIQRKK